MRNLRRTACLEREQFTLLMIVKKTKNLRDAVRKEKRRKLSIIFELCRYELLYRIGLGN